jgi:hypothetical protein
LNGLSSKIANPELQRAITAERERIRMPGGEGAPNHEHRSAEIPEATAIISAHGTAIKR